MEKSIDIAHILRHLRQSSGLSILEVADKIKSLGIERVKDKTIYNYEVGRSMPNADVFLELCVIYGCRNPLDYWKKQTYDVGSEEESAVLDAYRKLKPSQKDMVLNMLNIDKNVISGELSSSQEAV